MKMLKTKQRLKNSQSSSLLHSPSKMEDTVNKLEAMFQRAETDIDYISRKLDSEFSNMDGAAGDQVNPAKMMQKITEIKKEYASLVKEAEAIKQTQQEAVSFFRDQLLEACSTLQKLQNVAGTQSEKSEDLEKVEQLLGVKVPFPEPSIEGASCSAYSTQQTNSASDQGHDTCNTKAPTQGSPEAQEPSTAVVSPSTTEEGSLSPPELSACKRQAKSDECIEIQEAEFMSVSSLVRGRVKLCDVNRTYRILWSYFKEEENSEALTPAQMYKMGLRVTGQTGEAKLKVLRALKLLQISRKGDVSLL